MVPLTRPLFLFDGDCGVCQNGTDAIRAKVRPAVDVRAYQGVDLADLGVSDEDVREGPVLVRIDGSHVVGPLAMAEVLRSARAPFRQIGAAMMAPGVRRFLSAIGPVMYRHRGRLPGATDACQVTPATSA